MKRRSKDPLWDQAPSYGLEALVSTISDRDELVAAIMSANEKSKKLSGRPLP